MSSLLTYNTIIEYVKLRLGYPIVDVELTDEQIKKVADHVLDYYSSTKPVEKHGEINVIAGTQKYDISAGSFGRGIIDVFRPDPLRSPISLEQFDVFKYHTVLPNLAPSDYYLERIWWNEVRRSAGSDDDYYVEENTDGTASIYVNPIPSEGYKLVYVYVDDCANLGEVPKVDDDWIRDYCLAMCKQTLGMIRGKFASVNGAESSIEMDGSTLRSEGDQERKDLDEYLKRRGQIIPPMRG